MLENNKVAGNEGFSDELEVHTEENNKVAENEFLSDTITLDVHTDEGKTKKKRNKKNSPPWLTKKILNLLTVKDKFRKKYKKTQDKVVLEMYRKARNTANAKIREEKKNYADGILITKDECLENNINQIQNKSAPPSIIIADKEDISGKSNTKISKDIGSNFKHGHISNTRTNFM